MTLHRVVITGMGAVTPIGKNITEYFTSLKSGVSGANLITLFDASNFKTKFACEVKDFNIENLVDRKEARKLDRFAHFAIASSEEAILQSKLNEYTELNEDRVGVIWGSGIGGLHTFYEEVRDFAQGNGIPRFNPFFIPKMILDIAAGHISMRHGYRGPNYATVSACASSTNAIIDSFELLRYGKADAIICGGSEAAVTPPGIGGFNAMKALSERNDDFSTASRPFDKDRDGFVLGEGGGSMVLETLEHAQRRGATIYAEVIGAGMSADAHHITAPHPEGLGALNVMKTALADAGLQPNQVQYINVHGTSTPLGDIAETKAILGVFGEHAYQLNISSTKSMTGHLLGGAGIVEALACVMAITESVIPPTINHFTDDDQIDPKLNLTFNKAQQRNVEYALSNTFGFGGHNASVILGKF